MENIDLKNLTLENFKYKFDYISSPNENTEFYHTSSKLLDSFNYYTDIYFRTENKIININQIETFLKFYTHLDSIEIEKIFLSNYTENEKQLYRNGSISNTFFEVIEIQINNTNFDMVLICSKKYRNFIFFKKEISLRIEFLNNKIQTAKRKIDTTIEN